MKVEREKILEIKSQLNIIDLISEYITLKKMGSTHWGLCPFHNEKTPSFSVNAGKQFYHCFGCQENGDVFSFIQKIEGISFPEALTRLAERANIKLETMSTEETKEAQKRLQQQKKLFRVNELANKFFEESLDNNVDLVKEFMKSRNISYETVKDFHIGYAPDSWNSLTSFMHEKHVPLTLASELGLIRQKKDTPRDSSNPNDYYDIFRHRIVFPIVDISNKVLGFSCRRLSDESETDQKGPKYINSPESYIYKKRRSVYGMSSAYKSIHAEDNIILVEGNIDCVALSSFGFKTVVATLGTALTPDQIQKLKRLSHNITVIFDGDKAGQSATYKAFELFADAGLNTVKTVSLPEGTDPDSYINEHGKEKFDKLLKDAKFLIDHLLDEILYSIEKPSPTDKIGMFKDCMFLVNKIKDNDAKEFYKDYIDKFLGRAQEKKETKQPKATTNQSRQTSQFRGDKAEETITAIVLHSPLLNSKSFRKLQTGIFESFITEEYKLICREFIKTLNTLDFDKEDGLNVTADNYPRVITDILMDTFTKEKYPEVRDIFINLISTELRSDTEEIENTLSDCLATVKKRALEIRKKELKEQIKKTEASGDTESRLRALQEYQMLFSKQNV